MFTKWMVPYIRRIAKKRLGRDIAPLRTMSSHPDVMVPYVRFSSALENARLVPARLKALAQIRVARLVECPF